LRLLETVLRVDPPLTLKAVTSLEAGLLQESEVVVVSLEQAAVVMASGIVSRVGLPLPLPAVMVLEAGLLLGLQVQVEMSPERLVVWKPEPGGSFGIPGFEFSEVQNQREERLSLLWNC
jgi:hypothetical protein